MPKTKTMKKRIYTYEQLNSILRKRGVADERMFNAREAPLYGRLLASWHSGSRCFHIYYRGKFMTYDVAYVHSVAGGDTVYAIPALDPRVRKSRPKMVAHWRRSVERFTPHVCDGRSVGLHDAWYRLHDGNVTPYDSSGTGLLSSNPKANAPRNGSLLFPSFSRPSLKEWTAPITTLPKFVARAKRFVVNLKAALPEGIKADVQLMGYRESTWAHRQSVNAGLHDTLCLHVCLPPTEQAQSKRLVIATRPHDSESRIRFHVDGDYGIRHSQFAARVHGELRDSFTWPCAKDAIVGIKEWVMGSIYIPGL